MPIVSLPVRVTSRADFVAQLREAMSIELPQLNREGRQLLVAHAAYESGYGGALGGRTGRAFRMGWDFGNIVRGYKGAGSTWDGASWKDAGGDTDGAGNPIDQEWRIYTDLRDAVRDYWAFLGWSRYIAARNILEASTGLDSDQFAAELKKGGYFGLSLPKYQAGLATTLAQVASGWGA